MAESWLDRFVAAQDRHWDEILAELRSGRKVTHWMWYVFPQLKGLGRSPTAVFYGIADRAEVEAYLAHPVLGPRLREAAETLLRAAPGDSAEAILGPVDALKLRSCATLFDAVAPGGVFKGLLERFCGGERDSRTLEMLGR